jgi:tetratricopeptide (TPR) repeat protein
MRMKTHLPGIALILLPAMPAVAAVKRCSELDRTVISEARSGSISRAVGLLAPLLASGVEPAERSCAGQILAGIASILASEFRFAEAENLARRAVEIIESSAGTEHRVLTGALHSLAMALIQQRKLASARSVLRRMQALGSERPEYQALVHEISAYLFVASGKPYGAESEFAAALNAWETAGRGSGIEASDVCYSLSLLYIDTGQLDKAKTFVDRAIAIAAASPDALPADRMKLLNARAVVSTRRRERFAAEADVREALSISQSDVRIAPEIGFLVIDNYATMLRDAGRKADARALRKTWQSLVARSRQERAREIY